MANLKEITLGELRLFSQFLDEAVSALLHTILFVRAPSIVKAQNQQCKQLAPLIFAKCGPIELDQTIHAAVEMLKQSLFISMPISVDDSIRGGRGTTGHLKGEVLLSFFEKHDVKEWGGLVTRSESVCFERWRIPVLLLDQYAANEFRSSSRVDQLLWDTEKLSTGNDQQQDLQLYRRHSTGNQVDHAFHMEVLQPPPQNREQTRPTRSAQWTAAALDQERWLQAYTSAYEQVNERMMTILETVNASSDHVPLSMYDYDIQVLDPIIGEQRERRLASTAAVATVPS